MSDRADRWLRRMHAAEDGSPRLVCFPHAGGSASFFHPLSRALSPKVEVHVVQYPGRQDRRREPLLESIPDFVEAFLAAAGHRLQDRPALYGHSMGAILAFEVARRLQRDHGAPPDVLIVSGQQAPSVPQRGRAHLLDDEGLVEYMRRLGGTDTALLADAEIRAMVLPAVRSDHRAIESYRYVPGPRLRCPVIVMTGASDPVFTPDEARPWREHTTGSCSYHGFEGGHFFISEHATEVVRIIGDGVLANTA